MKIFEFNLFGLTIAPSYYGLMYALGFIIGYYIIKKRGIIPKELLDDLFFYIFLGVIFGGRLGYILFYNLGSYIENPLSIFKIWEGGMSFHGGVIGVTLAMYFFSKKIKFPLLCKEGARGWSSFLKVTDQVTLVLPIGLGLGRIGNYLNGELLGYSGYNGFLAIYKNGIWYFPSPLIEALLEGLVLFIILNIIYKRKISQKNPHPLIKGGNYKKYFDGQIASLFLIGYGVSRIIVEIFFRTPDSQIGYILGYFTMGEILSLPMIIIGVVLYYKLSKKNN